MNCKCDWLNDIISGCNLNPLIANPTKSSNKLKKFDHFVGFVLKRLRNDEHLVEKQNSDLKLPKVSLKCFC